MKILIKSQLDLEKMRQGGQIAARILNELAESVKPGITTADIENLAQKLIADAGVKASFQGFHGYPAATCVSINDEVVHGIPSKNRLINEGDILGIDLGIFYEGFHTDTAVTVAVGNIDEKSRKLMQATEKSLYEGIKQAKIGHHLGDISNAVQKVLDTASLGIIKDLTGHGVGKNLQESPAIPNYGKPGTGPELKEGMVLAIEPMATLGDYRVDVLSDGWTIATRDGSRSAHYEHTVAITKNGPEILTKE